MILADVARVRAMDMTEVELMASWREDPFVSPSASDPRRLLATQARLWQALPAEFTPLELSPLTALGSVTKLSGTGQNRVISSMRGSESVYDPVHPLALEASRRRRSGHTRVHLAACHHIAQAWDSPNEPRHETRFGAVSSAPEGGSYVSELALLGLHLGFWAHLLPALSPTARVEVVSWDPVVRTRIEESGITGHECITWGTDGPTWRHPYMVAGFRIVTGEDDVLGDGGLVPWTQMLTGNRKDRCVVSGISVDRLSASPEVSG